MPVPRGPTDPSGRVLPGPKCDAPIYGSHDIINLQRLPNHRNVFPHAAQVEGVPREAASVGGTERSTVVADQAMGANPNRASL